MTIISVSQLDCRSRRCRQVAALLSGVLMKSSTSFANITGSNLLSWAEFSWIIANHHIDQLSKIERCLHVCQHESLEEGIVYSEKRCGHLYKLSFYLQLFSSSRFRGLSESLNGGRRVLSLGGSLLVHC
jgi:hypothetical protein